MTERSLRALLESVRLGDQSVDEALTRLRSLPFEDLGFAKVDHHRGLRCGFCEVIYAPGKTLEQIEGVFRRCADSGANVLVTRLEPDFALKLRAVFPKAEHHPAARCLSLRQQEPEPAEGFVSVVCAGTSDIPVAEEVRVTLELMDRPTRTFYDVGVAGLHRLLAHSAALQQADVIVVVAGMDGALPSVVGGLVRSPVIAVPTSVGYGASFHGVAALLTMLNSCAAGVTVVNIDNGFGAGYAAALIHRSQRPAAPKEPAALT
ncbi:MAG: nickel pincer cofactor biosynthesis protein LarB [Phycisphaerae bacterium]|nr:nickel pincer cofactor biosynthesis protein LarB [Phycisphaerae bacterium]